MTHFIPIFLNYFKDHAKRQFFLNLIAIQVISTENRPLLKWQLEVALNSYTSERIKSWLAQSLRQN